MKKLTLALAFFAVLASPAPAAASSQVAVILFFCSVAAVVPGPWQQPLQFVSSHKDTLLPGVSFFVLRLLLVVTVASLLQKLVRLDTLKFASLSVYVIPTMSLALLVDHSSRQSVIDALSLSSATSYLLKTCFSALPPSYISIMYHTLKLVQQRWVHAEIVESVVIGESSTALLYLGVSCVALLMLIPILWTALKKCCASLDSMTLQAIVVSQLSATFILPRVPEFRSSVGCVLCVLQLLAAPYLRHRSMPFPTEKNRRLFIVCVIPIAMAYNSEGVELSVLIQAILDMIALVTSAFSHSRTSDSSNPKQSNSFSFRTVFLIFVVILLAVDIVCFQVAASYVAKLVMLSYAQFVDLNLTFISMFVLTWGANYDAGFPALLVVIMTLLLPSLTG